jgi:hypothetical protein
VSDSIAPPTSISEEQLLLSAIARIRISIMAITFGFTGGVGLSLATLWLMIQGGQDVGLHLNLLGNYFPGYSVTWGGCVVGFFYGALTGAVVGTAIAWMYNTVADKRRSV